MVAFFGLPINMLDDFQAEVSPERWNGFPVPLVPYYYAAQIAEAVGDEPPAWYEGLKPYDGLAWQVVCPECGADAWQPGTPCRACGETPLETKACPGCGSSMTREVGLIDEPCCTPHFAIVRKTRLISFW